LQGQRTVQGQMRHSKIETTINVYAQIVPESQCRAVGKMTARITERIGRARQGSSGC
jgi:hypothetical protein